jgi:hypothetical protein
VDSRKCSQLDREQVSVFLTKPHAFISKKDKKTLFSRHLLPPMDTLKTNITDQKSKKNGGNAASHTQSQSPAHRPEINAKKKVKICML